MAQTAAKPRRRRGSPLERVTQNTNLAAGRPSYEIRDFNQAAQIELLDLIAARVRELSKAPDMTPSNARQLAVAAAVIVDKRRLIDGEVTDRTETLTPEAVQEIEAMRTRAVQASAHLLSLEAGAGGESGAGVEVVDVPAAEDEGRAH